MAKVIDHDQDIHERDHRAIAKQRQYEEQAQPRQRQSLGKIRFTVRVSSIVPRDHPMKAESWEFVFSERCDVVRVKDSLLFELRCVLVRLNHVVSLIVNANHSITCAINAQ